MPELPEVEAFKTYIQDTSLHKTIAKITSSAPSLIKKISFTAFKKALIGSSLSKATRKGKYILLSIKNTDKKVVMHFGLTGSVAYTKDPKKEIPFSKVIFYFEDNGALHWIDKRKFGALWLVNNIGTFQRIQQLGPDSLTLSYVTFKNIVDANKQKNIKSFLTNQKIIAGIGNEYADEILFQAGINPTHKIKDLSDEHVKKIYQALHKILTHFTKKRITDIKHMGEHIFFADQDIQGINKKYLIAHRHGDKKCPHNKTHTLKKISIGGRSTYYCPKDQT